MADIEHLQPSEKSFGQYISLGYQYAVDKTFSEEQLGYIHAIGGVDDAILIIDDIVDQSKERNSKPSLWVEIGTEGARRKAEMYRSEAGKALDALMQSLGTTPVYQQKVLDAFSVFLKDIDRGEQIDRELTGEEQITKQMTEKYFQMIRLFTGGHIRYGLEMGQLLANKEVDPIVSAIAESMGIIRQIYDDFSDYFPSHHELFGDFLSQKNRLPEMLFKQYGGKREDAKNALQEENYTQAREIILHEKVRNSLYDFCLREMNKVESMSTLFDYKKLYIDFSSIKQK